MNRKGLWNDNDYEDDDEPRKKKAKESKASTRKKKTVKKKFYVSESFLDKHSDEIKEQHMAGEKPRAIAAFLRTKYLQGLRDDAITAKQIDNYIQYRKRTGLWKTRKVSSNNSNLRGDSDDCMF
jgi:hypothetical protein